MRRASQFQRVQIKVGKAWRLEGFVCGGRTHGRESMEAGGSLWRQEPIVASHMAPTRKQLWDQKRGWATT